MGYCSGIAVPAVDNGTQWRRWAFISRAVDLTRAFGALRKALMSCARPF